MKAAFRMAPEQHAASADHARLQARSLSLDFQTMRQSHVSRAGDRLP
jgi:hypothetical protein